MTKAVESAIFASHRGCMSGGTSYPNVALYSYATEHIADGAGNERERNDVPRMRIWGILSAEDEQTGFDLVLDQDSEALHLLFKDEIVACFDPGDYTLPELRVEVNMLLKAIYAVVPIWYQN